jgi:hypothetical protein
MARNGGQMTAAIAGAVAGVLVALGVPWVVHVVTANPPPSGSVVLQLMDQEVQVAEAHSGDRAAQMPFAVYTDGGAPGNHYVPSGYMGDHRAVTMNQYWTGHPHHGKTCIRVTYRGAVPGGVGWAGVYWQSPANNWGTVPGLTGYNLSQARRLTFWVRGTTGAERVQFLVGGITGRYGDSLRPAVKTPVLKLSTSWQRVTITLAGKNLTHIIGGFGWVASAQNDPHGAIFYLDDIVYSA